MGSKFIFFKYLVVAAVPFACLLITNRFQIFKKKPHLLFSALAIPTMIMAYLLTQLG